VADYFLPPAGGWKQEPAIRSDAPRSGGAPLRLQRPAALPILALPIGGRDVVRAAFAWNLVVEVARLGGSATLLAPAETEPSGLWPEAGPGPVGSEVVTTPAGDLPALHRAALDLAVNRAAETVDGGVVVVQVPPDWLRGGGGCERGWPLLRWALIFASPERRDLIDAYATAKRVLATSSSARVGLTIHGARRISEAERAFQQVAGVSARHLGRELVSYGLLVDDLHVYRAIVSRRPIGLEHPQSRAARALRDVARLVLEDARKLAVA
jgi:hypothetical protein